ncbi:MAG TPA: HlyD family efflux transporter periplasmic adaptor subunit [Burkholderiaceae bacterium]|jgi:HlyD family secretion protein
MKIMFTFAVPIVLTFLVGCSGASNDFFSGYAEGDYVRLASPIAGTLTKLYVNRGDMVARDTPAFVLEQESERAARVEAISRVEHAQAQLADLKKGKRPDEIAAIQAQLAQAQAALQLSSANFVRQKQLVADKFISPAVLDEARSTAERDQGHVNELNAQLRVAKLGARSDEIDAAERDVQTAQAQLAQANWKLEQKTLRIPVAADVADVLYREGELVPAGSPVVSLLPPENIKARFFVPEPVLGMLRLGQDIALSCDKCGAPIPAKISYISREAEYTAPLIYSKENRSTLVFMIEARPSADNARRLHPGQPLEIRLADSNHQK